MLSYAQSEDTLSKLFKYIETNFDSVEVGFTLSLVKYKTARSVLMRYTKTPHNEIQGISLCVNTIQANIDRMHLRVNTTKDI